MSHLVVLRLSFIVLSFLLLLRYSDLDQVCLGPHYPFVSFSVVIFNKGSAFILSIMCLHACASCA